MYYLFQISDLVKKYNREGTSVWASVDSTIMKNCRETVRLHLSHYTSFVSIISRPHTLALSPFFSNAELLHALHVHCKAGFTAAPALLHRPSAICSPRREFPPVLHATNHKQVCTDQIFPSYVMCMVVTQMHLN